MQIWSNKPNKTMPANFKMILEKEVIVIDSSSEGEMDEKEEEKKEKKKERKKDGNGSSESRSKHGVNTKAEEYRMLADLSSFPGLADMLAAEASIRENNRRRNQIRKMNKKLKKMNRGEESKVNSGANQLVPFESGNAEALSADDIEKLKMVNNCRPEDITVPRCSFDGPQGSIASGAPLSSSGEKTTEEICCGQVQLDLASTEVFIGEEKSNGKQYEVASMGKKNRRRNQIRRMNKKLKEVNGEERNDDSGANQQVPSKIETDQMLSVDDTEKLKMTNNSRPEDITVSRCSFDGPEGSIASGPPLSSSVEKTTGEECCSHVQLDLASAELFIGEEKSNEEQYKVSMREKKRRRHQIRRMNRKLKKADDIRKLKIEGNCKAEDKTVSQSPVEGLQPPVVSRHPLLPLEEKMSGHNYYCRIQWDSVAEAFLGKSNGEQDKMVDDTEKAKRINNCEPEYKTLQNSCNGLQSHIESGPPLSSSEGSKVTADNCYYGLLMDSIPTKESVGKEKNNDEQDNVVHDKGKEKLVDSCRDKDRKISFGTESVSRTDNLVLQKLSQPLRYFNPPATTWITCYLCGEGNHIAAQCSNRKRKKPCFICADPGHRGKKCMKVNNCFICHRKGHLAIDCPQKDVEEDLHSKSCLKCGDSGHDMSSCDNTYCSDDLKKIQCCVCKEFGHLCCLDYATEGPRQVSCYTCGKSGHVGSDCTEFHKGASSSQLPSSGNKHEESQGAEQMQYMKAGEEGNFPTLESADQRDGAATAESRVHMFVEADRANQNAQMQRINVTQGWRWPRRNNAQRTQGWRWPRRNNAQRQRVNVTQGWGWPRRNNVWVRAQQPESAAQHEVPCPSVLEAQQNQNS